MWRLWLLLGLCFLALSVLSADTGSKAKAAVRLHPAAKVAVHPNVILITLDTTRADRMGFLGSARGLTPNLDRFASEGIVFQKAYSHVPLTPPSHATILTGTYPQYNHVVDFGSRLGADVPYLPDILHRHGYKTAAFVSSVILDPVQGSGQGFDRGFDSFDADFHHRMPGESRYGSIERRAQVVVAHALTWLDKHPRGPYFLWLHFYDAHDPYDPPEPFKTKYASEPYDGEIAYVDSVLGKFFADLKSRGLYDGAMVAIMADHGEALGQHGETAHGVFLYDETIHVPMVIKLPKSADAGEKVQSRVGLVDVTPTILSELGVMVPKEIQGQSLIPLIKDPRARNGLSDRPMYAETDYPRKAFGWSSLRALRTGKYLFVEAPRDELYDQSVDPQAKDNIATNLTAVTSTLTTQIDSFRQKTSSSAEAPKQKSDPEAQEKLNALGYVASDDEIKVDPGVADTRADPKDKVEIVNLLHDAILDVEETKYEDAVPLLQRVLSTEPGIPIAYMQLGSAYTWLGQFDKAVPVLRKAVQMRSDALMPHYELGLALSETGNWEESVPQFEAASQKSPKWAALHFSLAAAYGHVGRMDDARKELLITLKLNPKEYRANLVLGRMYTLQGKPMEGVPYLKIAAKLRPSAPEPHMFLADAYDRAGQKLSAQRERSETERLRSTAPSEHP